MPLYWIVVTSIKPNLLIYREPQLFPSQVTLDHFGFVLGQPPFLQYIRNSVSVTLVTTSLAMIIGTLAAYAIVRLSFAGRRWVARSVVVTYLVPGSLLFIPMFQVIYTIGLIDNIVGLMLTYLTFTVPFATWMMIAYFRNIRPYGLDKSSTHLGSDADAIFTPLASPSEVARWQTQQEAIRQQLRERESKLAKLKHAPAGGVVLSDAVHDLVRGSLRVEARARRFLGMHAHGSSAARDDRATRSDLATQHRAADPLGSERRHRAERASLAGGHTLSGGVRRMWQSQHRRVDSSASSSADSSSWSVSRRSSPQPPLGSIFPACGRTSASRMPRSPPRARPT